jgi:CheY-like chemotaxis protein
MTKAFADNQKPLVWVIEDQDGIRGATARNLNTKGFEPVTFVTHDAAWEAAQKPGQRKPDVILADWDTKSDMNGGDFVANLRKSGWKEIPVISISGNAFTEENLERVGMQAQFPKGDLVFEEDKLEACVNEVIAASRQ